MFRYKEIGYFVIIFLEHSSQVMSLVSYLQSALRPSKYPKFIFQLAQMKSGSSGLKLKSSQQLVPSLSERVTRINQEFYGSMEGQESMKDESQQIKMFKAKNAMTEHKLKPWQEVEKTAKGIDAQD
jgi:hypothetical protein